MANSRKLSDQTLTALRAFASQPGVWRYGYDLTKETGLRSGTLYPLLLRLGDQGLLEAEWRPSPYPGRPARHAYRLTALGVAAAQRHAVASPAPSAGRLART